MVLSGGALFSPLLDQIENVHKSLQRAYEDLDWESKKGLHLVLNGVDPETLPDGEDVTTWGQPTDGVEFGYTINIPKDIPTHVLATLMNSVRRDEKLILYSLTLQNLTDIKRIEENFMRGKRSLRQVALINLPALTEIRDNFCHYIRLTHLTLKDLPALQIIENDFCSDNEQTIQSVEFSGLGAVEKVDKNFFDETGVTLSLKAVDVSEAFATATKEIRVRNDE